MVNSAFNSNMGFAYAKMISVLMEGPDLSN
jgi:hypothetical protein